MPLSDYEQRMLKMIEQKLLSADPKLAENLSRPGLPMRRWLKAAALCVSGFATLLSAIIFAPKVIPLLLICSILCFLLTVAGAVCVIAGPLGTESGSSQ
jgi:hypothetical protein